MTAFGVGATQLARSAMGQAVQSAHELIQDMAGKAPLSMRFNGTSPEQCRNWQLAFETRLCSLLGPHKPPQEWQVHQEDRVVLDDHIREELVLNAEGHPALPVHLLLPKGVSSPLPGILALHGHGEYGYDSVAGKVVESKAAGVIAETNYDYGRQLARRGYAVAIPCFLPFGRRSGNKAAYGGDDICAVTFVRLQLLGKVLIAENLRDALWAFELLARHPEVDSERIGCVGLSYGGRMTMLTAALEQRIRVAVISGALNVMQERIQVRYSCGAQVIPGLLQYGDVPEIASLIAPRPCLWEIGSSDGLIDSEWAETALGRIRKAYGALNAPGQLQIDRFSGAHRWNGVKAYPLLEKVLNPGSA